MVVEVTIPSWDDFMKAVGAAPGDWDIVVWDVEPNIVGETVGETATVRISAVTPGLVYTFRKKMKLSEILPGGGERPKNMTVEQAISLWHEKVKEMASKIVADDVPVVRGGLWLAGG